MGSSLCSRKGIQHPDSKMDQDRAFWHNKNNSGHEKSILYQTTRLLSDQAVEEITYLYEDKHAAMSPISEKILLACLTHRSDLAAVHAYRALKGESRLPELAELLNTIEPKRLGEWIWKRWVVLPDGAEKHV